MFKKVWLGMLPLVIVLISLFSLSIFLASAPPVFASQLPSYKTLCTKLKDLPGWQAEKCEGMNVSGGPMGGIVSAHRSYMRGKKRIEAMIISGMQAMGYWKPFASHMQMESNEVFIKMTNIKGYPVGTVYHKQDKSGVIVVRLTKREEVTAVFVVNFENMGWQKALKIAEEFDWKKMGRLLR